MALTTVKAAGIAADSIDETKIADNGIDSEHYNDGSIDHAHLAADCVDGDNIQDDVINSEHIAAGAVDLEHMSSQSVDEDNLYISNAGTNGQYLQKQSGNNGGLTWADVSAGVTSDGQYNTVAGTNAGDSFNGTNATDNTLYGFDAGTAITDGDDNTFIGYQAGAATAEASLHVAVGHRALASHNANAASGITGNTAIGTKAMEDSTSAYNTVAVGREAMLNSVDGYSNTMLGFQAGKNGFQSGNGHDNIGIGALCFDSATSAVGNVGIGAQALEDLTTGDYNTVVGQEAGKNMTTGTGNAILGYYCAPGITEGENNVAIGNQAMSTGTIEGDRNTCVGLNAGNSTTSGSQNTCIGGKTGNNITTGSNNTLIGYDCGYTVSSGSHAVCLGYRAGQNQISTTGDSLWIAKGANGAANGNVWIYGSDGGACTQGNNSSSWTTTSDQRLKKNIVDNNVGLSIIDNLKVRNFEYRTEAEIDRSEFPKVSTDKFTKEEADEGLGVEGEYKQTLALGHGGTQIGIIAQELESVAPSCVTTDPLTGVKTVDTDEIMWHMLNAIKELSAKVKALEAG